MDKANLSNTFVDSILDEIALEGLDGVTISALWIRLKERPDFPFPPVDDKAKSFLWRAVIRLSNVEFFLLPKPRAPLVLFNRTEYIDQFGNFVDPDDVPDNVYPHAAVEEDGLMGSCQYFKERVNITSEVRKKDLNFAIKKWGERLVAVADQATRKFSLCIPDFNPQVEMTVLQYCFLERIGRSRYYGEVTQGKLGLQQISVDAKMLFYYRKYLTKHKLIVKQTFHLKIGKQNCTGSLLHLTRFCKVVKTKHKTDAENLLEYLKHQPGKLMLYKDVYKLDLRVDIKKLLQKELKCIKSELVPYRRIFPDAKPQEWKIKSSSHEKSIRILRLVEEENVEEINDEEEEDEEDESGFLDISRRVLDRTILRQTYRMVEKAGKEGLTQLSISTMMGVSSLHSRSLVKQLVKKNLCGNMLIDIGRQRVGHFYAKKYDLKEGGMSAEVSEERKKLLQTIYNRNMLEKHVNKRKATDSLDEMKSTKRLALEMCEKPDESSPPVEISSNGTPSSSKLTQEDMDTIETEIIVSNPSLSGKKSFPSLTEAIQSPNISNSNLTLRILKRANLILQAVNAQKVILDPQKLQRMINEEEELEGFQYTIDRKSVLRLVDKLEEDGHLKVIKVNLKGHGKVKNMTFICHPSVDEHHTEIQSAIDLAKMKLPIVIKETLRQKYIKSDNILGPFVDQTQDVSFDFDQKAAKKYGYKPKYVKMHILHMFMHYLTYGYTGDTKMDQSIKLEIVRSHKLEDSFADEMSFVYSKTNDWKMFVPPIPIHSEYGKGWSLMSDIILRLPLCLFVSIVRVSYHIPILVEYLEHPIRRYYLVKNIPSEITSHLTKHRKYIFAISEVIQRLGYIGLVQCGPQRLKEKDQIFYYLNRKACLIDTTPSDIGYNQVSTNRDYEQINYTFKTAEDVEQYWYDLWNFAMHTNLGCRTSVTGQPIVLESINTKKDVIAAVLPKTVAEARESDVGYIPGDKLGAAGVDSDMFVHLKRNWYWTAERGVCPPNINQLPSQRSENKISGKVRITKTSIHSNSNEDSSTPLSPSSMGGLNRIKQANKSKKSKALDQRFKTTSIVRDHWKSKAKPKRITRIVKPKNTKYGKKPYYDQKDREALTRMVKLRVDWTAAEDNLLLICKVASLYMCPNKTRHVLKNFCAVREILHSTFPETSRNKTSRACQRRMHYMMRNPSTVNSVYLCLEEIKQDSEITEKFDKAVEKLDAILKAKGEGPKGCQREYDKIYTDLVTTLMHKLKTVARKEKNMLDSMTIPNTVRQFYDSFNVIIPKTLSAQSSRFNEVQNNVDILCSVVNTIIHSSLCCANDKTSYSYQLFNIYKQYPDKLLRSVMAKCRSMSIVSCRKRYKKWKAAGNGCLALTSSPYQLSITYVNILQCRYQYSIFSECYASFNHLMEEERKKLKAITEPVDQPSTSSAVESSEQESPDDRYIELKVNNGGQCANVVELFSAGFMDMNITFPEHLIILDPRLSDDQENYTNLLERFKELMSIIKKTEPSKVESPNSKPSEGGEGNAEEEENDSEEDCDEPPSEPTENSENPKPEDTPRESESQNEKSENGEELEEDFLAKKGEIVKAASRLAIYMMRDEPLESLDKSLQHAHDYFVLNPCKISISLISEKGARSRIIDVTKKENLISEIKRLSVFPENHVENNEIINSLKSEVKCPNLLAQFLDFLEQKKELGATYMDIEDNFGSSEEVQGLLEVLVSRQFILKSGSINFRFIHNKWTKPWLVRSHFIPRRAREINVESMDRVLNQGVMEETRVLTEAELLDEPTPEESSSKKGSEEDPSKEDSENPSSNLNKEEEESGEVREEEEMQVDGGEEEEEEKEELLMIIDSKENDQEAHHNQNDDCQMEVDELDAPDNPDSKVLLKRKKRKWVNLTKVTEKYNDLDYSSMKSVHVVIRPWIKIDGTLNRRVLDRLLGSVLGHCLGAPGVTMDKIQARFTPALQPLHTLELVHFLVKLDCVHLYAVKTNTKPSLCSQRSKASIVPATGFERLCDTIIEPDLLAVSKFGQFIGDKAYKIDYLDTLTNAKLLKLS